MFVHVSVIKWENMEVVKFRSVGVCPTARFCRVRCQVHKDERMLKSAELTPQMSLSN